MKIILENIWTLLYKHLLNKYITNIIYIYNINIEIIDQIIIINKNTIKNIDILSKSKHINNIYIEMTELSNKSSLTINDMIYENKIKKKEITVLSINSYDDLKLNLYSEEFKLMNNIDKIKTLEKTLLITNISADYFKLIIDYIIDNNIVINFYLLIYKICGDTSVCIDTIKNICNIFGYLIEKKLIDMSKIDWFNTYAGISLIYHNSRICDGLFTHNDITFLDFLIKNNINIYDLNYFIYYICEYYIIFDKSYKKLTYELLKYLINNCEFNINIETKNKIDDFLKFVDYEYNKIYDILYNIPTNTSVKSAMKNSCNNLIYS